MCLASIDERLGTPAAQETSLPGVTWCRDVYSLKLFLITWNHCGKNTCHIMSQFKIHQNTIKYSSGMYSPGSKSTSCWSSNSLIQVQWAVRFVAVTGGLCILSPETLSILKLPSKKITSSPVPSMFFSNDRLLSLRKPDHFNSPVSSRRARVEGQKHIRGKLRQVDFKMDLQKTEPWLISGENLWAPKPFGGYFLHE